MRGQKMNKTEYAKTMKRTDKIISEITGMTIICCIVMAFGLVSLWATIALGY